MFRSLTPWLLITAFMTGAGILVIELMGTRLLAPFFGSGMYTWSALIAITMAALASGYASGGYLVDRYTRVGLLFILILAAAVWTAITPSLAGLIIPVIIQQFDLRTSVLLTSLVLFFPSLFLLASVSPFVIRLLTQQKEEVGMRSGHVFATSTVGSLLGALLTGFYIMPNVAVTKTFLLCAILLSLISVIGLIISGNKKSGWVAVIAMLIMLPGIIAKKNATTNSFEIIEQASSFYGQVQVIDRYDMRVLLVDGIGQNYLLKEEDYAIPYVSFISALPQLHKNRQDKPQRALVIGLGAGQIPMRYNQSGITTDVVEIDETVIQIAAQHFGFVMPSERIHAMDGRVYLSRDNGHYDYLLLDAFLSDQIAWHLLSIEALTQAKQHLSTEGLLVINILSTLGGDDIASVHNTLQQIFPFVRTYAYPDANGMASHVLIAADYPLEWSLDGFKGDKNERRFIKRFLKTELTQLESHLILKDDYNPLTMLRQELSIHWRKSMWKYLGEENLGWLLN